MHVPAEINRANGHDVRIKWRDGAETLHPARELRLACPCAQCVEEMTGRRMLDASRIPQDVHPVSIHVVGRYALGIAFSDGHSSGIFTFDLMRSTGKAVASPLTPDSTMGEVLEHYPSAKSALFRKYHVGGCQSCGYEPTDKLGEVLKKHNVLDVQGAIRYIEESESLNAKIHIEPAELKELLHGPKPPRLLDVRTPEEWAIAKIPGAELVDQKLAQEIMEGWDKDTPIVMYCHVGERSLDTASFLIGHGFSNVRSLSGGIEAWSEKVDPSIPRY